MKISFFPKIHNKKARALYAYTILFEVLGILIFTFHYTLGDIFRIYERVLMLVGVIFMGLGLGFILVLYVRFGIIPLPFTRMNVEIEDEGTSTIIEESALKNDYSSNLDDKFETLKKELIDSFKNPEDINKSIENQISKISEETIYKKITDKFESELISKTAINLIEKEINEIKTRIEKEAARLSRYGYINLFMGVSTTVLAISFLGYWLISSISDTSIPDVKSGAFYYHLFLRLSLSILIEIFSFFFLKLYKSILDDIKYFNNERTNIEMKIVAIKTSVAYGNKDDIKKLMLDISKTERNFILKKGESTVELEKIRTDSKNNDKVLGGIEKLLSGVFKLVDRK